MKIVEFTNEHRRKHFEFFASQNHPHFNLCANVDIGKLLIELKNRQQPFMASIAWLVSKVANEIPQLRQRIRGDQVVEHESVHPSFSVPTEDSEVFSFCEVDFSDSYSDFIKRAKARIAEVYKQPSFEDADGRDDYLFLSSMPWVSFTSVQHAMHYHPHDSVPRITWGKYFNDNQLVKMPLSLQAHHALVDGSHAGLFFNRFEALAGNPKKWKLG